jgi:glutamyl/glutaminyl-tRNA synthetase
VRRGVNIEALKSFIINQGASRRVITMEWDKFWAENKKVLEEQCARYMGVDDTDKVLFTITNVSDEVQLVSVQIHPQKPELGNRVLRRCNKLYVDQADALTFNETEVVTFLRWGNFHIDKIVRSSDGSKVLSMEGRYDAESTDFKKTKKTTWLAALPEAVPCIIMEFDHLISKAKLGDDEDFKDFVNPVSKREVRAGLN